MLHKYYVKLQQKCIFKDGIYGTWSCPFTLLYIKYVHVYHYTCVLLTNIQCYTISLCQKHFDKQA